MVHYIRWGILATGNVALTFTRDLLVDPKTRGVNDIVHTVTAAASSSSADRAREFLLLVGAAKDAQAYGSYAELANDPSIDIVYVSTPHSHHYQNVMLCLEAGKNVLCEKALTVNAAQAKRLAEKASEKRLFLMQAAWTRYFPLSVYVRELVTSGALGNVTRVSADNSVSLDLETTFADGKSRMVNPNLAGGALLDMGIYSLTWVFQCLFHTQPAKTRSAPKVYSSIRKYDSTGVDESAVILLVFPRASGGDAHGIATTSFRVATDPDRKGSSGSAIRVQGDKGEVQVWPSVRPTNTRLILGDGTVEERTWTPPGPGVGSGFRNGFGTRLHAEGVGHGMFYEADEAARALLERRLESRYEGLDETIVMMEVMDEVRRQGHLSYPQEIESLEYPIDL